MSVWISRPPRYDGGVVDSRISRLRRENFVGVRYFFVDQIKQDFDCFFGDFLHGLLDRRDRRIIIIGDVQAVITGDGVILRDRFAAFENRPAGADGQAVGNGKQRREVFARLQQAPW